MSFPRLRSHKTFYKALWQRALVPLYAYYNAFWASFRCKTLLQLKVLLPKHSTYSKPLMETVRRGCTQPLPARLKCTHARRLATERPTAGRFIELQIPWARRSASSFCTLHNVHASMFEPGTEVSLWDFKLPRPSLTALFFPSDDGSLRLPRNS